MTGGREKDGGRRLQHIVQFCFLQRVAYIAYLQIGNRSCPYFFTFSFSHVVCFENLEECNCKVTLMDVLLQLFVFMVCVCVCVCVCGVHSGV